MRSAAAQEQALGDFEDRRQKLPPASAEGETDQSENFSSVVFGTKKAAVAVLLGLSAILQCASHLHLLAFYNEPHGRKPATAA